MLGNDKLLNVTMVTSTVIQSNATERPQDYSDYYKGLALALTSCVFIGTSFIVKKKGLLKVARTSSSRAGEGGYAYLKEWMWWTGLITMIVGEAANFTAYAFAPAILVTPLGALSVLVSAVLASIMLKERLNLHGKVGCFLCIVGSTVLIIHAPPEDGVANMEELSAKLREPLFIAYTAIVIVVAGLMMFYVAPIHGTKNVLVYVTICSLIGSLTVMACKGLGLALKQTLSGSNQLSNPVAWMLLVGGALCIMVQMNYLNKALDIFNTSIVTPIYYVFFTTFTITASAILYQEWARLNAKDAIGSVAGFLTIISGVFLLHAFRDVKFSLRDLYGSVSGIRARSTVENGDMTSLILNHDDDDDDENDEVYVASSKSSDMINSKF